MTTPALQDAIRRAYEAFGSWNAPAAPLNVCTGCCMPEDLEREMRTLPLRQLTARHFYEYCSGAMGHLEQPVDEVRYLLPRWLELIAEGEHVHHSVELYLDRVGRCGPGSFTAAEARVLDAFMLAHFEDTLARGCLGDDRSDPLALLIMADAGGLAVQPLLQHWLADAGPASTAQFVLSTYWGFWPARRLDNAFASDRAALQAAFKDWMLNPATKAAFAAKLLDPAFLAYAGTVDLGFRVPFPLMVEAVFDHLSH